jgi:hypothetical protein
MMANDPFLRHCPLYIDSQSWFVLPIILKLTIHVIVSFWRKFIFVLDLTLFKFSINCKY